MREKISNKLILKTIQLEFNIVLIDKDTIRFKVLSMQLNFINKILSFLKGS